SPTWPSATRSTSPSTTVRPAPSSSTSAPRAGSHPPTRPSAPASEVRRKRPARSGTDGAAHATRGDGHWVCVAARAGHSTAVFYVPPASGKGFQTGGPGSCEGGRNGRCSAVTIPASPAAPEDQRRFVPVFGVADGHRRHGPLVGDV